MIETGNRGGTPEPCGDVPPTITSQQVPEAFWASNPRGVYVVGEVAYVPLTQGAVAIIDAEDVWRVEGSNWYLHRAANRSYAALRLEHGGRRSIVYMHQVIAEPAEGMDVDHREGPGLDNRRANLRVCTRRQNLANTGPKSNNRLGVKGVWRHGLKYRASIQKNGKTRHLGGFDTIEEASAAYQSAARQIHGEFAR